MKVNIVKLMKNAKYMLLCYLFLPPSIIVIWPSVSKLHMLTHYIGIAVSIWLLINNLLLRRRLQNRKLWVPILLLGLWILISNSYNESLYNSVSYVLNYIKIIAYLTVIEKAFRYNESSTFLTGTYTYCLLICVLNLVSQIMYPNIGIYHNWENSWQAYYVCGNDNNFVFFYLFSAGIALQCDLAKKKKVTLATYVFMLLLIYSTGLANSLTGSSTGFVIMLIITVLVLLSNFEFVRFIKEHYKVFMTMFTVGAVWFIVFNGWNTQWVKDLINDILNENISFYERGFIWNSAIERIKDAPLLGNGSYAYQIGSDFEGVLRSAHNTFLQMAIYGGIPALIFFFAAIIQGIRVDKESNSINTYISMVVISLYLLAFLFEQNPFYIGFYAFLMINRCLCAKVRLE